MKSHTSFIKSSHTEAGACKKDTTIIYCAPFYTVKQVQHSWSKSEDHTAQKQACKSTLVLNSHN